MKKFDISRFLLTVKWDLISNWKDSLKIMLTMTFAQLIMFAMMLLSRRKVEITEWLVDNTMGQMGTSSLFIFGVFMIVGASRIFSNMKTKQQRTAFLMLPASNAEKFVMRWLWATVGQVVLYVVALLAADLLQALFGMLIGVGVFGSVTAEVVRLTGEIFNGGILEFYDAMQSETGMAITLSIFAGILMIFIHTFYVFGGTFFRRNPWLLTTCAGFILLFLVITVDPSKELINNGSEGNFIPLLNVWSGILAVLTVTGYWFSYLLFKRMQVINNKWANV